MTFGEFRKVYTDSIFSLVIEHNENFWDLASFTEVTNSETLEEEEDEFSCGVSYEMDLSKYDSLEVLGISFHYKLIEDEDVGIIPLRYAYIRLKDY